ncbi:MAG: hypothetical protein LBL23_01915 [Coriobacteriales bacterium]|jgi:hypothetical protein|nr:hypothetical protein [Coriobacteriales bacterium]
MVALKKEKLQKALKAEGTVRDTVFKGFYIYKDQYVRLVELTAQNKIKGIEPSSQSEILRAALDEYLEK